jgi:DNA-binding IclR family transcriptional regulator
MNSQNNSIDNACRILLLMADFFEGLNLTEVSQKLGINKSTAYRYLSTLENYGFLEKKENRYALGLKIFEMGNRIPVIKLISEKIYPLLLEFGFLFNETISLGVLSEDGVVILERIEKGRSLINKVFTGTKVPVYCTGLGKAILSVLPPEQLEQILAKIHFEPFTPNTITTRKGLMDDIVETRKRGFSIDNGEYAEDLKCVAVPLSLERFVFRGAVSVTSPKSRLNAERVHYISQHLQNSLTNFTKQIFS